MVHGTPAMKAAGAGDGDEFARMAQVPGNAFKAADAGYQLGAAVAFESQSGHFFRVTFLFQATSCSQRATPQRFWPADWMLDANAF